MSTTSKKKHSYYVAAGILFVLTLLFVLGTVLGLGVMTAKYEAGKQSSRLFSWLTRQGEEESKEEFINSDGVTTSSQAGDIIPPTPQPHVFTSTIALPRPAITGGMPLQQVIAERRSRREFSTKPLSMQKLSQLLWSAQGITDPAGKKRAAPSAYEVYPITIYAVVRNVPGLNPGLYEYLPASHSLGGINVFVDESVDPPGVVLANLEGMQDVVKNSPIVFVMSASYGKGYDLMKEGAVNSAILEVGHIAQNLYLQAESLKLATVVVAGFDSNSVVKSLNLRPDEVLYLMPVGERALK